MDCRLNASFLVALLSGIATSVISLAGFITGILNEKGETMAKINLWSFFFGLILASIWLVGKTIKEWTPTVIISLLIGAAIAFFIASIQTVGSVDSKLFIVLSGAIAICAMILPGISGSFILVLLGSYHVVLSAIKERDLIVIGLFGLGCFIGLMTFARVLKFLFSKFHNITIALLTGFMIGSLYKIWPWKINVGNSPLVVHSNGKEDWMQANVLPSNFKGDPQLLFAVLFLLIGLGLIVILERLANKIK